jgi:hypothetical protein
MGMPSFAMGATASSGRVGICDITAQFMAIAQLVAMGCVIAIDTACFDACAECAGLLFGQRTS